MGMPSLWTEGCHHAWLSRGGGTSLRELALKRRRGCPAPWIGAERWGFGLDRERDGEEEKEEYQVLARSISLPYSEAKPIIFA